MFRISVLALMAMSLVACGGGSGGDDQKKAAQEYQMAVDQAAAKQAEAISLAPASPCNTAQQCGNLTFSQPQGNCQAYSYRTYSLVSATADAASAAAADERTLAQHAATISPPPIMSCVDSVVAQPTPVCVANACQGSTTP